jgi:hypothetical protein
VAITSAAGKIMGSVMITVYKEVLGDTSVSDIPTGSGGGDP